jgi:hypothetical protein
MKLQTQPTRAHDAAGRSFCEWISVFRLAARRGQNNEKTEDRHMPSRRPVREGENVVLPSQPVGKRLHAGDVEFLLE